MQQIFLQMSFHRAVMRNLNGNLFREQQNLNLVMPKQPHAPAKPQCREPLGTISDTQGTQLSPHSQNDARTSPAAEVTLFFPQRSCNVPSVPANSPPWQPPCLMTRSRRCHRALRILLERIEHLNRVFLQKEPACPAKAWSRRQFYNPV